MSMADIIATVLGALTAALGHAGGSAGEALQRIIDVISGL